MVGRSGINVPFAYGGIFVLADEGVEFDLDDLETATQFADAVALGYTRFLDLQAKERRVRQAEIERAVEGLRKKGVVVDPIELNVVE